MVELIKRYPNVDSIGCSWDKEDETYDCSVRYNKETLGGLEPEVDIVHIDKYIISNIVRTFTTGSNDWEIETDNSTICLITNDDDELELDCFMH